LKESVFLLFLKTGFSTPDVLVSVTKIEPKYSRTKINMMKWLQEIFET